MGGGDFTKTSLLEPAFFVAAYPRIRQPWLLAADAIFG